MRDEAAGFRMWLNNDHGVAATRAGMKEAAVREPPARIAGVDARAPWFFHALTG
jgi:hypothetical protein